MTISEQGNPQPDSLPIDSGLTTDSEEAHARWRNTEAERDEARAEVEQLTAKLAESENGLSQTSRINIYQELETANTSLARVAVAGNPEIERLRNELEAEQKSRIQSCGGNSGQECIEHI